MSRDSRWAIPWFTPLVDRLDRQPVKSLALVSLTYVLLGVVAYPLGQRLLPFPFYPQAGLAFTFGVVFGPVAAGGAAIGRVMTAGLTGTFGLQTMFGYLSQFALAYVGYRLWTDWYRPSAADNISFAPLRAVLIFVLAGFTAASVAAAIEAWGAETVSSSPFAVVIRDVFVGTFAAALLLGLPCLLVLTYLRRERWEHSDDPQKPQHSRSVSNGLTVLLPVVWGTLGFTISVMFQPLKLEPRQLLVNRFGSTVVTVLNAFGPNGKWLQFAIGLVFLSLFVVVLER